MAAFDNYIAGDWVSGANRHPRPQPVQPRRRRRRICARRRGAGATTPSPPRRGVSGWAQARSRSARTCSTASAPRSSRARTSSGRCFRARRARRCRRASARPRARGRSSASSPARSCGCAGEKLASVRPGVDIEVTREPIGVIGLITPWNFPIAIPAWKIAPALAYGNTVVFKPADLVPGSAWALADIIVRAGRAAGRVQPGDGPRLGGRRGAGRPSRLSPASASPARSRPAARIAAKAIARMAKVQLEMGGKNPLVVLDDADLRPRSTVAVQGAYFSTGQRCTASSRLSSRRASTTVSSPRCREGWRRSRSTMRSLRAPTSAPSSTRASSIRTSPYLDIGREEGAKLVARRRAAGTRQHEGFYLAPALFTEATNEMRITREEIFGPVAC